MSLEENVDDLINSMDSLVDDAGDLFNFNSGVELNEDLDHVCLQNNMQITSPSRDPTNTPNEPILTGQPDSISSPQDISNMSPVSTQLMDPIQLPNENIVHQFETPDALSQELEFQQLAPMTSCLSPQIISCPMLLVSPQSNDQIQPSNNSTIHHYNTPDTTSEGLEYQQLASMTGLLQKCKINLIQICQLK